MVRVTKEKLVLKILKLDKKVSVQIKPKTPFNFDATVFKPDHFPTPDHIWKPGKYWQAMRIDSKIVDFKLENKGTIKNRRLKFHFMLKKN
jgi:hypothetical protein